MKVNENAKEKPMKLSVYELARRTLCACMLGEDNYYEDGKSVMNRLKDYSTQLNERQARKILLEAKDGKLRHAPAYWAILMAKQGQLKASDVHRIVDRADLVTDMLALYKAQAGNTHTLPNQLKKGLAASLTQFDEYQFGKYKADNKDIKMRDAFRWIRPKPMNQEQAILWKKVVDGTLAIPDTWEVGLTNCHTPPEKKAFWERILTEKKLGSLALIRNLRNMNDVGVSKDIIRKAIKGADVSKLFPYQIYTAYNISGDYEQELEEKFFEACKELPKLPGSTLILVDCSGSMTSSYVTQSKVSPAQKATCLAAIAQKISDYCEIYPFDGSLKPKAKHYGFALIDNFDCPGGLTSIADCTRDALKKFNKENNTEPDRVIVFTDNCSNSDLNCRMPQVKHGYSINLDPYDNNGIEYGQNSGWNFISGFSENIFKYIGAYEELR